MPLKKPILFLLIMLLAVPRARSQQLDSLLVLRDSTIISEEQIDLQLQIAYFLSDSDIRAALDGANQALRDAEVLGSVRWIAEAKLAVGSFIDYLGVNEVATNHLMEAFASFVELKDSLKQATTLMQIGNTYFYLDQFSSALKYYSLVSEYGRAMNDTTLIISGLNSTAAVYGNTSRLDSALILFNEALDNPRKHLLETLQFPL